MRKTVGLKKWITTSLTGLALAGMTGLGLAQTTNNPNTFDTTIGSWTTWWGMTSIMTWSDLDAGNDLASGSLRYDIPFVGGSGEQIMTFGTLANGWGWDSRIAINATRYTNMVFDIKIDPTSAPDRYNQYGSWELGLVWHESTTNGWGQIPLPSWTAPLSATNWTHVVRPIDPTLANLDMVVGTYIKLWSGGRFTNTLSLNVDNMYIEPLASTNPPPPPPTVGLKPAVQGLNLITTDSGQYQRQSIYTTNQAYSWVGRSGPVTYSMDIKDAPTAGGFQTHMFLVPMSGVVNGPAEASIDWSCASLIFFTVQDGGASLRYKTNQPSGNSMLWNSNPANGPVGLLATLPATSAKGTWKLTFENNTSITVTGPSGTTTNVSLTSDVASMFADPLIVHVGAQPNDPPNIGMASVVGRVQITGAAMSLDDSFTGGQLNTNLWGKAAADPNGVLVVPEDSKYWFTWTLPAASDAYVMTSTNLVSPWKSATVGTSLKAGTVRQVLLSQASLPSPEGGFFALGNRVATRLQVLLPGETNAPDTATGVSGTPDVQLAGIPFNVVVNACDDTWHVLRSSVTVHLTTTDTGPLGSYLPQDAPLVNGTATFTDLYLYDEGSWTITATDMSTENPLASGTSSPVTIRNP